MQIMPVIDLLDGQVVHAIAGNRAQYRPIQSQLVASSLPTDVAQALACQLSLTHAYVADLDALQGGPIQWHNLQQMATHLPHLWCDVGIRDCQQLLAVCDMATRLNLSTDFLIPLESLSSVIELRSMSQLTQFSRLIFSLDLRNGQPICHCDAWRNHPAWNIVCEVLDMGWSRLLVLDLATVGSQQGVSTLQLCRRIRDLYPTVELATGGGVRSMVDLRHLLAAGVNIALVGTALHQRQIGPCDIQSMPARP